MGGKRVPCGQDGGGSVGSARPQVDGDQVPARVGAPVPFRWVPVAWSGR